MTGSSPNTPVAVVTGASRGIGSATALLLARRGMRVALWARTAEDLRHVADTLVSEGHDCAAVLVDIADEESVRSATAATMDRFGRIDVLVNNAAANHAQTPVLDLSVDEWRRVIDVNLTGTFLCIRHVVPTMVANGRGNVINVSSIGGRRGGPGRGAYRVTKAGLINLTETLAAELHDSGVRVNCVCPGGTRTDMVREIGVAVPDDRLMSPDEIAEVIAFLASDASSAISGASIDAFGTANPLFRTPR